MTDTFDRSSRLHIPHEELEHAKFVKNIDDTIATRTVSFSGIPDSDIHGLITAEGFLTDNTGTPIEYSHYRSIKVSDLEYRINFYDDGGANVVAVKVDFESLSALGGNLLYSVQKIDVIEVPISVVFIETDYFRQGVQFTGLVVGNANLTGGEGPITWEVESSSAGIFEFSPNTNRLILGETYVAPDEEIEVRIKATDALGRSIIGIETIHLNPPVALTAIFPRTNSIVDTLPADRFITGLEGVGGVAPYTFTIEEDLDAKFKIVNGTQLWSNDLIDIIDISHDVTIKATDSATDAQTLESTITMVIDPVLVNTSSLEFDGSTQFISIPRTSPIPLEWDQPFIFSSWVKRLSTSNSDTLFTTIESSSNNAQGFILYFDNNNNNRLLINVNNSGANQIRTRFVLGSSTVNVFHHLITTYDGSGLASGIKVYLDNVEIPVDAVLEDGLDEMSINNASPFLFFGARGNNSQNGDLRLDQTLIYRKLSTIAERTDYYNGGVVEDIRLKEDFNDLFIGFEWEDSIEEVKKRVIAIYTNEDANSFSSDVP